MELISIGLTFLISTLFISNFLYLFTKSLDQNGKIWEQTLFFSLFNFIIGIAYTFMLIKLLFLTGKPSFSQWIWIWKLQLSLFLISSVLVAKFGLNFLQENKIRPVFNLSLVFIAFYIIAIILINIDFLNVNNGTVVNLKEINLGTYLLEFVLLVILIFYFILPVTQLFFYLQVHPNKSSNKTNSSKSIFLIIGILTVMLSLILHFLSLTQKTDTIITISDLTMFFGGIILFYSLKLHSNLELIDDDVY